MERPPHDPAIDATRRTRLASERTELAWWRTGMTVFALALAVSRVIPELANETKRWPYVVTGVVFAVYGIALVAYGSIRRRRVDRALSRGEFPEPLGWVEGGLVAGGILLGLLTVLLVVL